MKHYVDISKKYFLAMEGVGGRAQWKNWRYWIWFAILIAWMYSIYATFSQTPIHVSGSELASMVIMEAAWLGMTFFVLQWRERAIVSRFNAEFGTAYKRLNECRESYLSHITGRSPGEYLALAKEISDISRIRREFKRKSELSGTDFLDAIYNKDARPRLLTLFVACLSMMVALTVKTDASLETIFDAFADSGWRNLMLLVATISGLLFMAATFLKLIAPAGVQVLAQWAILLFKGGVFEELQLTNLVRDLIHFYKPQAFHDVEHERCKYSPQFDTGRGLQIGPINTVGKVESEAANLPLGTNSPSGVIS